MSLEQKPYFRKLFKTPIGVNSNNYLSKNKKIFMNKIYNSGNNKITSYYRFNCLMIYAHKHKLYFFNLCDINYWWMGF